MALQSSGAISLNDIHVEAGGSSGSSASMSDTDIRGLISKGLGSSASFNEWYGASNYPSGGAMWGPRWVVSAGARRSYSFYWNERMDYGNFTSNASSADFGDHPSGRLHERAACSNGSRVVFSGAYYVFSSSQDYVTTSSLSNSVNFGSLNGARHSAAGVEDTGGRGLICGGSQARSPASPSNIIDYIQISTVNSATDFGNCISNVMQMCGASGTGNRSVLVGGKNSSSYSASTAQMQYITTSSTSNANSMGSLTQSRVASAGHTNGSRGVFSGGKYSTATYVNTIDYITITSTANATDFGDTSYTGSSAGGGSDGTYGMHIGGYTGGTTMNRKDRFSIGTTGNSTNFGTLGLTRHSCDAGSGST